MARVKVKLNRAAVRELLTGPEVTADLGKRAERIASAAGPGFEHETTKGSNRARAAVWTGDAEARKAEADERALTRALDSGGGS